MTRGEPIARHQRIAGLDALRGFALFGILFVNMTWFTGFVLFPGSLLTETLVKFLVINLIWVPIHLVWLAAGNLVNQLDLSPQTHFRINCAMALAMVIVVGLAIFSLV